jgi:hypothetical protein
MKEKIMKAIRYTIRVGQGTLIEGKDIGYEIEEIAISCLGLVINHAGIHCPHYFDTRLVMAKNRTEISIIGEKAKYLEDYAVMIKREKEIIQSFNLKGPSND